MSGEEKIEEVYQSFWKSIIEKDGVLDIEAVKRELFDYRTCMVEVSKVYMHITGGQLSKPNTAAEHIIAAHDKAVEDAS